MALICIDAFSSLPLANKKKKKKLYDHNYRIYSNNTVLLDRLLILRGTLTPRIIFCNGSRNCGVCVNTFRFFFCSKLKWRSLHQREHFSAYLWQRFTKLILTCWWYVYLQIFLVCLSDDFLSYSPSHFIFISS